MLWDHTQGSYPPGPWCSYVPNWDHIESLKNTFSASSRCNQAAALLYSTSASAVSAIVDTGRAQGVCWFYATDRSYDDNPWNGLANNSVYAALVNKF